MKLYKGTVEFEIVVAAENEDEAREIMEENAREEFENVNMYDAVGGIREVKTLRDLPYHWEGNCIPWASDGVSDDTIAEYFAKQDEQE